MAHESEQRFRIENVLGSAVLVGLACALYLGFVITLFAGFTADIQRDLLSRELGASSPGSLERMVLEGHHEAELRQDLRDLRFRIREIDTHALDAARRGFALRKDAITAWWAAFDSYSRFGRTVANNKAAFEAGFTKDFLQALNAAYLFVSSMEMPVSVGDDMELPFGNGASNGAEAPGVGGNTAPKQGTKPIVRLDVPVSEGDVDEQTRTEGIRIMARLHGLMENPEFAPTVAPDFTQKVDAQLDDIRATMMNFDEKSTRAQIEWANIRTEQKQATQLRSSLQAELNDINDNIERLVGDGERDSLSLVSMFEHPVGRVMSYLIQLPTIMLTLLVTVAAGGLGAVVAFTRQNFKTPTDPHTPQEYALDDGNARPGHQAADQTGQADQTNPKKGRKDNKDSNGNDGGRRRADASWLSAARLLIMTGEGIAAAMAIFLFSEAGMLMLTQGGADGSGQVDISPYLVTFMAFVSGFMAEDAFNRIQLAGKKIFRVQPGNDDTMGPGGSGL